MKKRLNSPLRFTPVLRVLAGGLGVAILAATGWCFADAAFRGSVQHTGVYDGLGVPKLNGVKWSFHTNGQIYSSPAVAAGRVFFGSNDGNLYALRRADLSLAWETSLAVGCIDPQSGCGSLSTPAFDGATLFVGAGVRDPSLGFSGSVYVIASASALACSTRT